MNGLSPRVEHVVLAVVLAAYLAFIAIGLAHHEPWADEAQAWLIARDASLVETHTDILRYEGTPGLWHLVLSVPAKLGLPYASEQVVSWLAAGLGVALLLFASPLPLAFRILLPFTYFPGFQYSVIARSYALVLPLLGLVAWAWPRRRERWVRFTIAVVLLSQTCVHAALIAVSIIAIVTSEALRDRAQTASKPLRARLLPFAPAAVLATVLLFNLWELAPPDDLVSSAHSLFKEHGLAALVDVAERAPRLAFGLETPWVATGLLFTLALVLGGAASGGLLLSSLALLAFLTFVGFNVHHVGPLALAVLFWTWVQWGEARPPWRRIATGVLLALLFAGGLVPTFTTWRHDLEQPWSGSRDAAAFLRDNGLDHKRIWGCWYYPVALQPYFDHNLLANQGTPAGAGYFTWSTGAMHDPPGVEPLRPGEDPARMLREFDVLVDDLRMPLPPEALTGFRLAHTSPGSMWFFGREWEQETYRIWIRDDAAASSR